MWLVNIHKTFYAHSLSGYRQAPKLALVNTFVCVCVCVWFCISQCSVFQFLIFLFHFYFVILTFGPCHVCNDAYSLPTHKHIHIHTIFNVFLCIYFLFIQAIFFSLSPTQKPLVMLKYHVWVALTGACYSREWLTQGQTSSLMWILFQPMMI